MDTAQKQKDQEECTFCKVAFLFAFTVLLCVFVYTFMHRTDVLTDPAHGLYHPLSTSTP